MKIMVVEDEQNIRQDLEQLLQSANYETITVLCFDGIPDQVARELPDLILLDIQLPASDGFTICKKIREKSDIPIIFITGNHQTSSEISGMLLGGDDYITKPYHPSLLLARIAAVLKRTGNSLSEFTFQHKGIILDIRTYKLMYGTGCAELTKNECKLMGYLMQHKGEVVSRMELLDYLWDHEVFIDDNALTVTITRIRKKLEELGACNFIETKRGVGYRI